jgi:hypothetical protein
MKAVLPKLQAQSLVSASEAEQLGHIIDAVASDRDLDKVAREVRDIHWRLVDESAGPIALAISNMATNSTALARDKPVQVINDNDEEFTGAGSSADLDGMLHGAEVGAGLGAAIGSPAGVGSAALGAFVGGLFGSILGGILGSS